MKDQFGKDMVSKAKKEKKKIQTFQDTILNLQKFWSKKGCIIFTNTFSYLVEKIGLCVSKTKKFK